MKKLTICLISWFVAVPCFSAEQEKDRSDKRLLPAGAGELLVAPAQAEALASGRSVALVKADQEQDQTQEKGQPAERRRRASSRTLTAEGDSAKVLRGRYQEPDMAFEVVPLVHLDLGETTDLIHELEPRVRIAWSGSINALVLRGERRHLDEIMELLGHMEKMSPGEAADRMKVLKLKNRRWGDIERHLMLTVGDMVTMAGDEATGQVIVQGPPEQIELTGRLVRQLDQPQRTVKLTFDFLLVGYDPHFEAVEGNAPPRVSRVWEALEETGARQMTYLGSAVVQSAESEEFATEGVQGAVEPGFRYEIEGQVNFMEPEDTVRIRVEAEAVRVQHGSKQASGWEHGFQVESTLTAKMGEAVVLASAPAGEQTGPGSVVIVVQADWPDRSEPSP